MTPREEYEQAEQRVNELQALIDAAEAGRWKPARKVLVATFMEFDEATAQAARALEVYQQSENLQAAA